MYESYFGLNEKPFTITPDPRYLFMSERHGEGLAHLVYGITESGGFIQLTGEVGTGKTTLVRTMLNRVPAEVDIALILNPQLSPTEFLAAICEELGAPLPKDRSSSKALVDSLNQHLLATHAQGRRTILLVDEAQNLSRAVLEQLRLLTNLETARQKLLQIILIAQPELRDMLSKQNLRQLAQRVTGRYHLEPLSREETATYIDHRLRVAGALRDIFDATAKKEIYRLSGGVPRVINVICDRSLLGAYSSEKQTVDRKLVRQAAEEVAGEPLPPRMLKWAAPLIGLLLAAILIVGMLQLAPTDEASDAAVVSLPLGERAEPAVVEMAAALPPASDPAVQPDASGGQSTDVIPIASEPVPEPPPLAEQLAGFADSATGENAVSTLFDLWGIRYSPGSGGACPQARAQGFGCAFQRGSWSGIRQLDRPVVLTLTDEAGNSYQSVLAATDDGTAELLVGDSRLQVPVAELLNFWFGQYLLIWRAPNGNGQAIRPGMRDANVLWLRQSLATIDNQQSPSSIDADYFDDGLEQRVRQFQRENRLQVDGLAGHQTQIAINSRLALDGIPRLSRNADAAM
ncbi:MAG: AAA family ATPase [Gammaproteobacteria bacterium]|nr:AAA family ATPase [Gammaproteobacteria bacterium]